jgi:hypothetical protein
MPAMMCGMQFFRQLARKGEQGAQHYVLECDTKLLPALQSAIMVLQVV